MSKACRIFLKIEVLLVFPKAFFSSMILEKSHLGRGVPRL